jgi:hypothetical protein
MARMVVTLLDWSVMLEVSIRGLTQKKIGKPECMTVSSWNRIFARTMVMKRLRRSIKPDEWSPMVIWCVLYKVVDR